MAQPKKEQTGNYAVPDASCMNWGLQRIPASQGGVLVNLEPLVGTVPGVTRKHEFLRAPAIAGGMLMIGGAVYFSFSVDCPAFN